MRNPDGGFYFCPRLGMNYTICLNSRYKLEPFQLLGVFRTGGDQVDTGGFDAGMPQQIRQLHYILAGPIKSPGEEVP